MLIKKTKTPKVRRRRFYNLYQITTIMKGLGDKIGVSILGQNTQILWSLTSEKEFKKKY